MRKQHKGQNGRILIVGGSEDYVGAPVFSAMAALVTWADIVVIAAPEKAAYAMNRLVPDVITKKLYGSHLAPMHVKEILGIDFDVMIIGPGLGADKETARAVNELVTTKKPKVIDADALKFINPKKTTNAVITPHEREFERLFGKAAVKSAARKDLIILRKGQVDEISDGKRITLNKTGNAGMTRGGTGDILAGVVAGFLCKGLPLYNAACAAAWVNGTAGDICKKKLGDHFTASDVVDALPKALKKWEESRAAK
ncbi:MAG: NAD(P)H-hydrate dehydratase [Candidatus Diapherotrites archaeon]|nr:NAD(P)H-hydrate dehydratase [Candidatus Diapherotrites archaeon]